MVSAPEECLYRQHGQFGDVMRSSLSTAFAGNCSMYRAGECKGSGFTSTAQWLETLKRHGSPDDSVVPLSFETVDGFFRAFAQAISVQYRMAFGGQSYNETISADLPRGEVHGLAWSTTVCTSYRLEWLILPALLTVLTAALLAWMVVQSWARRHIQPCGKTASFLWLCTANRTWRRWGTANRRRAAARPDRTVRRWISTK